jgi:hypothetical protein
MSFIKTLTIDGFYPEEGAKEIASVVVGLGYKEFDFGQEIEDFNMVSPEASELFSNILKMKLTVDMDRSGIFRFPKQFIHFEDFNSTNEWIFVVALQESIYNTFEHKTGAKSALDGYKFNYRNLFEWDLMVNYILKPGQGILFRPWLFHSFDTGLIQIFRFTEE